MNPLHLTTVAAVAIIGATTVAVPYLLVTEYTAPTDSTDSADTQIVIDTTASLAADDRPTVQHQPLPEQVRAIYMTSCVAGTPSFRADLVALMERTEINAVVIDVKDYSGTISFPPSTPAWQPAWQNARCGTSDMKDFVAELHERGIFTIARITVFQDPFYAERRPDLAVKRSDQETVWHDYKGLSFIDVAANEYWDHLIDLSVDAYNLGFDELNFDYVRYPSDGNMQDIAFVHSQASEYGADKQANLEAFFSYLHDALRDEVRFAEYRHINTGRPSSTPWLSVDLFGMTTTNHDDLSIGQVIERAAPYFDFVAPMVYPSHYPDSFLGLGNPNQYPYKVVHYAMTSGVDRMTSSTTPVQGFLHEPYMPAHASSSTDVSVLYTKPVYTAGKLRTWIQDFDYGGDYGPAEVRAQIQASYDAGVHDFMIWAPSNRYTEAALLPATTTTQTAAIE